MIVFLYFGAVLALSSTADGSNKEENVWIESQNIREGEEQERGAVRSLGLTFPDKVVIIV